MCIYKMSWSAASAVRPLQYAWSFLQHLCGLSTHKGIMSFYTKGWYGYNDGYRLWLRYMDVNTSWVLNMCSIRFTYQHGLPSLLSMNAQIYHMFYIYWTLTLIPIWGFYGILCPHSYHAGLFPTPRCGKAIVSLELVDILLCLLWAGSNPHSWVCHDQTLH